MIKAVLFDLGSTLLEFENQPWEELIRQDVGIRKAHPQIFTTALEALQVAPHEAVFVGDRVPEDVAGAKRVGMRGVWKERPDRERLPGVIPDAQIVHLRELLAVLDGWTERHRL